MIKIHFIVNPIAGKGKNKLSLRDLELYFPSEKYSVTVRTTEFIGHAGELTKSAVADGAEIIVACGGDGTINEVASCLVNTSVVLGIVPMGSGNGLASNLKIPKNINAALAVITEQYEISIDTGSINGESFFSNMGVGFDAHVISDFEKNATRELFSYIKSTFRTLKNYNYKDELQIKYNDKVELLSPFLLFISNSNEMGYNMSLTPHASLQDGWLDLLIVPKLSGFKLILFAFLFLFKKQHWLKEVRFEQVKKLEIKNLSKDLYNVQKDGGIFSPEHASLSIQIHPNSLKVYVKQ